MARLSRRIILGAGCFLTFVAIAPAQRGGPSWNTPGGDAQRTSSVATDPSISVANMQKPGFQFLWKVKAANDARQGYALSEAITVSSYIGYRGFRAYAFFGGASNNAVALDSDLGRIEWARHFDVPNPPAATAACPGGMTAGLSRMAPVDPASVVATPGRALTRAMGAVGKVGEGAVQIAALGANAGRGGGRGGAVAGSGRGAAAAANNRGAFGANEMIALSSDGMLHVMYISNGVDSQPPVRLLPANANASALTLADTDVFVSTSGNCGGVPNGVWSMPMLGADKSVKSWKSNGGSVVGTSLAPDGTVFASTGDGEYSPVAYSDSVVSLDGKTLRMKDFFTPGKSDFTTAPTVFAWHDKQLIAAANKDGRLYLLDPASLGGADHHTPLAQSTAFGTVTTGGLATWEADGTRWIAVAFSGAPNAATKFAGVNGSASNGAIAAFKVVDQGGKPALQPAWLSRDMTFPATPGVINGVVFALSGGDAQHNAVLYALDGSTGKDLWNSGTTVAGYSRAAVTGSASQLYVSTNDSTVYAFGFPLVK